MIINIFILIFVCLFKNNNNLLLEYKRSFYKEENETFHFTEYFNNYIGTKLCFGSNNQCLILNFELNSFPTWIITYKSKSHNKNQTLYDQFSSESFYLKDSSTHVYVHSKFHWTYFCYDKLSFQNYNIDDYFFLGVEIFYDLPINSGIIGLDCQNRKKSYIPELNFVGQLKRNKIINNYSFSFIYKKFDDHKREEGNFLIGELPNKYLWNLNNKTLVYKNIMKIEDELKWGFEADKIYVGNYKIENISKVGFSIEHGVIIGSYEYKEYIIKTFFNALFENKTCYSERFEDLFQGFVCDNNLNIDSFENLIFKIGMKEFVFTKDDLFIKNDKNKTLFLVTFPSKDWYFTNIDWTFGVPFFKKYIVVFDMDKKSIGYYIDKKESNYELYINYLNIRNICIILSILIIFLFVFLLFYSKKKKPNKINNYSQIQET